jgi:phosphoribosylformylglycinamidine (FGAM) synthase-like enzyme
MNLMPEKKNNRNLTDKQKSFLDNLVATEGDFKKAAELAGYSGNHYQVLKSLKEEVVDLASDVLARSAPKAAFKLVEMIDSNKPIPQASQKLNAAQTILDRVGVAKTDRVQVDHNVQGGIFILPEKQTVVIEDAEFSNITEEEDE